MLITQKSAVEQRRIVLEQRLEERGELYDAIERIGHTMAAANAEINRGRERLTQQPCLAKTRSTFDDHHGPDTRPQASKARQDGIQLPVPTPQRRGADHHLASIS
jgi:hypothetical protein